ncbi:hypothetical protein BC835DRAFT_1396910, partial [Cytidiella melzeri]
DGGVEPPQFYHTTEEINATRYSWGHEPWPPLPEPPRDLSQQPHGGRLMSPFVLAGNVTQHRALLPGDSQVSTNTPAPNAPAPALEASRDEYNVHVGLTRKVTVQKPSTRGTRSQVSRTTVTKADRVAINATTTRAQFIEACLKIHDPQPKYAAGPVSGPRFSLWWTGSAGGKPKASSIDDDRNFASSLKMLLEKIAGKKDKKAQVEVSVEFDLDNMEGFCIETMAPAIDLHGPTGTQVPHVEQYTEDQQLHGGIILTLKKEWPCNKHNGDHGEPAYCYVPKDSNDHYGLSARKLKFWSAAIASHEYTKFEPPPSVLDGGTRDSCSAPDQARVRG